MRVWEKIVSRRERLRIISFVKEVVGGSFLKETMERVKRRERVREMEESKKVQVGRRNKKKGVGGTEEEGDKCKKERRVRIREEMR